MCDENNTHLIGLLKFLHQFQNLCLNGYVKGSCRFICDQKFRMTDQTHSDHDTLTHTTGKFVRILFHTFFHVIDSYFLKHLHRTFLCFFFTDIFIMGFQCLHQLITDSIYRIQTGHRVLEDHGYFISTEVYHLRRCLRQDILTLEGNRTTDYFSGIL